MTQPLVIKTTGNRALAVEGRIINRWKGGMSVMGWAKGSGAAAGITINIYGSSDPGTPAGTGNTGDGSSVVDYDVTKMVLVCSVHPTTASLGATGVPDATGTHNVICWWDYLYVEFVSAEGTTNACELTISARDKS